MTSSDAPHEPDASRSGDGLGEPEPRVDGAAREVPGSASPAPSWRSGLAARSLVAGGSLSACCALGSAPVSWHGLQWVALVPLLLAWEGLAPRRAFVVGWAAGVAVNLALFSWLAGAMERFGGLPTGAALLALVAFCALSGLQFGAVALVDARVRRTRPSARWLLLPATFVAVEQLWPRLFPWTVGTPQVQNELVAQSLDLVGPPGLTFLVVLVNAALYEVLRALGSRPRPPGAWRRPALAALSAALLLAGALGYGAVRREQVRACLATVDRVRVGWVQHGVVRNRARPTATAEVALALERGARALAARGPMEFAVFAEGASPHPTLELARGEDPAGPAGVQVALSARAAPDLIARLARACGAPALVGVTHLELASGAGGALEAVSRHNELLGLDGAGRPVLRYAKRRLLPLGEYLPGEGAAPWLRALLPFAGRFVPGSGPRVHELGRLRVAPLICYEAVWSGDVRDVVRAGAPDLLLNVTNDVWFGEGQGPHLHRMIVAMRALETRRPLLRVTATGISALELPDGSSVDASALGATVVGVAEVPLIGDALRAPYLALGGAFGWAALAAVALALLLPGRAQRVPALPF